MAQDYSDRFIIIGLRYFVGKIPEVHVHLPYVIMFHASPFQIYQNIAFQDGVVKNQIDIIMSAANLNRILFPYESETFAKFKKKLLHIINQGFLKT